MEFTEDVVQDTFIKAYTKLETFRGQSSFKSWLFKIGLNTAKNKLRSQRVGQLNLEKVHLSHGSKVENRIYHSNVKSQILQAIERLPQKQKEAIYLRIFEDLSFKEIADLMESPYDTAKANYRHGLMKLKNSLSRNDVLEDWYDLTEEIRIIPKIAL
ncbi:MAG: sigma-70 family RNA polymerase sigma factor [Bdellovibrionales bacterium]|nr:sigma-70 family RNA polymerase sigma factor [Bdellovibrionales bacterium]